MDLTDELINYPLEPIKYIDIQIDNRKEIENVLENYCRLCANVYQKDLLTCFENNLDFALAEYLCLNLEDDSLPKYICKNCKEMISRINKYREKCSSSQDKLKIRQLQLSNDDFDRSRSENSDISEANENHFPNEKKHKNKVRSSFLGAGQWMCLDCGEIFSSCYKMKIHRKNCEYIGTAKSKKNGPFKCEICGKILPTSIGYGIHKHVHEKSHNTTTITRTERKERPRERKICYICGKSFNNSSYSLNVHLQFHNKDKPFECEVCQKRYYTNSDLKDHMQSHDKERKFECDICNKKFFTRKIMRKHRIIHDDNMRRLQCSFCSKKFIRPNQLAMHMLVHSGLKPHPCDLCDKKFKFSWELKKHKEKKHNSSNMETTVETAPAIEENSTHMEQINEQNTDDQIVFIFTTETIEDNNEDVYFNLQA